MANCLPAISTDEPIVAEACRTFYARLLRIDQGVESILETAEIYSEEPAVLSACAFLWLFGQTPEAQQKAGDYLKRANLYRERLSLREKAWLDAMSLWHARSFESAASAFEDITTRWPEDLPAAKAAEFLYYILGQHASGARFLAHMKRLAAYHQEDADYLAMTAFAHELCGHTEAARDCAEHALQMAPINPWAQHALEHVLLWEGSPEDSVQRLESWLGSWEHSGRVIHCHNAWHVAVMHLDRLNVSRAFAVYEEHVWGHSPDMVVEQLDGIAFLWRAEMAGATVDPERYRAIAQHIIPLADSLFMPFVSAQYAYALGRAGEVDALERMLQRVDHRANENDADARWAWAPVGRSIVNACALLGRDQPQAASEMLDPVMDRMPRIGGSDAQDDLFRFAYCDSLLRSGRKADAALLLKKRLSQKSPSPLEEELLIKVG
jgi:tetratricopeptide (TPR) repeat protein